MLVKGEVLLLKDQIFAIVDQFLSFEALAQNFQHIPALVLQCELSQQQKVNNIQRGLNRERGYNKTLIAQLFQFQQQLENILQTDHSPMERKL